MSQDLHSLPVIQHAPADPTMAKNELDHIEMKGCFADPAVVDSYVLFKSRFDELSITRTLWVFRRAVIVVLLVYTGYVCEGFELGAGGAIVANAGFVKQFGTNAGEEGVRALSTTWLSVWSALLNVGQIVTFTHISWIADKFGRRPSLYLAWLWLAVGCVFLNVAKTPAVWALGKLCNGAGIGVLQVVCQVYVMEICPNRIRGGMVTFQAVWSNIGFIVTSVMMQQLNAKHPDNYLIAMRVLWAPIGIMAICWAFVPESPWFYARRGNKDATMKSLKILYGNVEGYDFEEEYSIIARTIEHESAVLEHKPSYMDVFRGQNLRRTLTVMLLAVCQQFAGLTIISTYSTYFFALAGLADPFLGSLILSCVNLAAIWIWSFTCDKFGRRMIIACSQSFVTGILFVVGGLYYTGATTGNAAAGTGLLVVCCFWSFSYQTIGMSYYLFSAELPSAVLRMRTGPITFFTNSILGIAACFATPPMLVHLSVRAAFVYGAFSVPIMVLTWIYLPETKGRSAAEIDELYERHIPAWRWSKTVTEVERMQRQAVQERGVGAVGKIA